MAQLCRLPENPSLEQLKNQARDLQRAVESGDAEARELFKGLHPRGADALGADGKLKLADAQLATARLYGFTSWPRMTEIVDEILKWTRSPHREPVGGTIDSEKARHDEFLRLACLNYGADDPARWKQAQQLLADHPEIAGGSLHAAAAAGDGDGVADWVAKRPRLASWAGGPFHWEPLLYLCYSRIDDGQGGAGFLRAASALLNAGADPNAGYLWEGMTWPFTALTGAFGEGEDRHNQPPHQASLRLATLLLASGADANDNQSLYNRSWSSSDEHLELLTEWGLGKGDGGPWHRRLGETHQTPQEMVNEELVKAAAMGRENRARIMLRAGADPRARGQHPLYERRTATELASLNGSRSILDMLVAAGADRPELTPVEQLVSDLLQGGSVAEGELSEGVLRETRRLHPSLIRRAAELRRPYAVHLLAELGFDVNHVERVTPLHEAAWRGDLKMAKLLIELGADPTIEDEEHHATPRGWALHSHHQEVADYLASVGG